MKNSFDDTLRHQHLEIEFYEILYNIFLQYIEFVLNSINFIL